MGGPFMAPLPPFLMGRGRGNREGRLGGRSALPSALKRPIGGSRGSGPKSAEGDWLIQGATCAPPAPLTFGTPPQASVDGFASSSAPR